MDENDDSSNNNGGSTIRSNDNINNTNGSDGDTGNSNGDGGHQGGCKSNKKRNQGDKMSHASTSFKGANARLKGHAFRHDRSENRDEHHETAKAIAQHVAEECDHSKDAKRSLTNWLIN